MKSLSVRRCRFIDEFSKTGNQTTAAVSAGFSSKRRATAAAYGAQLLRNSKVQAGLRIKFMDLLPEINEQLIKISQHLPAFVQNPKVAPRKIVQLVKALNELTAYLQND